MSEDSAGTIFFLALEIKEIKKVKAIKLLWWRRLGSGGEMKRTLFKRWKKSRSCEGMKKIKIFWREREREGGGIQFGQMLNIPLLCREKLRKVHLVNTCIGVRFSCPLKHRIKQYVILFLWFVQISGPDFIIVLLYAQPLCWLNVPS